MSDFNREQPDNTAQKYDKHSKFIKGKDRDHPLFMSWAAPLLLVSSTELAPKIIGNPITHRYVVLYNSSTDLLQPCVVRLAKSEFTPIILLKEHPHIGVTETRQEHLLT